MKIITEWTLDDLVALVHQELAQQGFQPEEGETAIVRFEDRQVANADLVVKLAVVKAQPVITTSTTAAPIEVSQPATRKRQAHVSNPEHIAKMNAARAAKRQEREAQQQQETVSLVEAAAPQADGQAALLEKIAQVEAKTNGHAGNETGKLEVVAATESPFR